MRTPPGTSRGAFVLGSWEGDDRVARWPRRLGQEQGGSTVASREWSDVGESFTEFSISIHETGGLTPRLTTLDYGAHGSLPLRASGRAFGACRRPVPPTPAVRWARTIRVMWSR